MDQMKFAVLEAVKKKPWAITVEMYNTIEEVLTRRYLGEGQQIQMDAIAKREDKKLRIEKKVAVVPLVGVIAKRMNMFHDISGGTSTEAFRTSFEEALNNPEADAIVLDIDSPGGTVDGVKEMADFVFQSRGKKPIVAYANSEMCSAAYWIGAAADKVTAYDTARIGSIGVMMPHHDRSAQQQAQGVKTTYLYAGKYKVMGADNEPLTEEGKEYLKTNFVDKLYTMFVDSVANFRGVSSKYALENMADGRVFLANEAQNIKLVDKIMDLESTIAWAAKMANWKVYRQGNLDALDEAAIEALVEIDAICGRNDPIHSVEAISYEDVVG
jgi:signal peptide peptidase SppA